MLVIEHLKCAYKSVCKSASSTIYVWLQQHLPELSDLSQHDRRVKMDIELAAPKNINFTQNLSEYFLFSVVRNPWSRLVSAHKELLRGKEPKKNPISLSIAEVHKILKGSLDFKDFVDFVVNIEPSAKGSLGTNAHWVPQSEWLSNAQGSWRGLEVEDYDFIGKVESIDADIITIEKGVGVPFPIPLSRVNQSPSYNYRDEYTPDLVDIVGKYYEEDIERFNYEF
tara:strand:+ start:75 stop:749 length:675 start_codon:yes stop_codon:yes gene_type:complete